MTKKKKKTGSSIKAELLVQTLCSKFKDMFANPLKNKHLKEFLHTSTLNGLRLLLYCTPFKYARLIWSIFILVLIIWTHFIIVTLTIGYIQQPTEVHTRTDVVHVSSIPFPSIAACSASKFSRTKLVTLAEEVFESQQIYKPHLVAQTVDEMAQHLLYFKRFFLFAYDNAPLNTTVISGLDEIFIFMFNSTSYPVRQYLKYLAPDCNDLVVRARIYEVYVNTSEYFEKRMTSSSVCCMFNYHRVFSRDTYKQDVYQRNAQKLKFDASSALNSIQIVLQSDREDFTVTEFQTEAFQIYVSPPEDYPTLQTTRIGEILVDHNKLVEVPIEPKYFGSSKRVRQFAPHVRNCYFSEEGKKVLNLPFYSFDECMHLCRMKSMLKHCGCVTPPMVSIRGIVTHCGFADLPCLMRWKTIWNGWNFQDTRAQDQYKRFTTGRRCPLCLPRCNGVDYALDTNSKLLPLGSGLIYNYGILKGFNTTAPLAIVKLYFKEDTTFPIEMDIVSDWVVLLNRFGGIMSLMYGFSIISYIEILYFATGKFFIFYFENWKTKVQQKLTNYQKSLEDDILRKVEQPPPAYNLYWKELQPQRLVAKEVYRKNLLTTLYKRHEI